MSYILDALTKAAQQRERQVPVVQRLLSPPAPRSPSARVPRRALAATALSAGLLAMLLIWWLRPGPTAAPPEPASVISAPAPRSVTVEPSRPPRLEPAPRPDVQAERPAPRKPVVIPDAPAVTARPAPPPPGSRPSAPPQPPRAATPPAPAAGPAAAHPERAGLKLEALIYSDLPTQRMVFINGRRYAEGDLVDGRLRVEEIQEDGVELSDQGQRFTLRVTR